MKRHVAILAIGLVRGFALAQCTPTPVGEWCMMEGSGTVVADSAGTNHGVIWGNCVWTNNSPWGALRALAFGGTA